MSIVTCVVAGCEKPIRSIGLCYSHYMKQHRYGTPTPEHASRRRDLTGLVVGELTVRALVEDGMWLCDCSCGATTKTRAGDLNRGSARSCGNGRLHRRHLRAELVGYNALHSRVKRDRGLPALHQCVGCGNRAEEWSYDHSDPNEIISDETGSVGFPYSLDEQRYEPRCVACHRAYDSSLRAAHA